MWDEKATAMSNDIFKEGELVRVLGDYAKINRDKNLEVHIGNKGKIILAPGDINSKVKKKLDNIYGKVTVFVFSSRLRIPLIANCFIVLTAIIGGTSSNFFKSSSLADPCSIILAKISTS